MQSSNCQKSVKQTLTLIEREKMKKVISIVGIFGFIGICCFTNLIESTFNINGVAQSGGLTEYCLLGLIASILIVKK